MPRHSKSASIRQLELKASALELQGVLLRREVRRCLLARLECCNTAVTLRLRRKVLALSDADSAQSYLDLVSLVDCWA